MKRMNKIRTILVLTVAVLVLTAAVGGTVAFLIAKTGSVVNTFEPAEVKCKVEETFTDGDSTKSNVYIQNTGSAKAYIRAAIVGNWYKDGKIVAPWKVSEGTFVGLPGNGWTLVDGFYYYGTAVEAGGSTSNLFTSYTPPTAPVAGAHLELTILCQAIQAEGIPNVTNAQSAWTEAVK